MTMFLNLAKNINKSDILTKKGDFDKKADLPDFFELYKKNILILGFGRIGQALAKRCLGFEANIYVYDPFVDQKVIENFKAIKIDNLNEFLKETDYVSIHAPLNKETRNLININNLKTMKKSSIIINTSRGGIINEKDLNDALNKGLIYGAGLDVFEKEPPDENNPLLKNKKIFFSPHSATFTNECMERMGIEAVENIFDFFSNKLEKSKIVQL